MLNTIDPKELKSWKVVDDTALIESGTVLLENLPRGEKHKHVGPFFDMYVDGLEGQQIEPGEEGTGLLYLDKFCDWEALTEKLATAGITIISRVRWLCVKLPVTSFKVEKDSAIPRAIRVQVTNFSAQRITVPRRYSVNVGFLYPGIIQRLKSPLPIMAYSRERDHDDGYEPDLFVGENNLVYLGDASRLTAIPHDIFAIFTVSWGPWTVHSLIDPGYPHGACRHILLPDLGRPRICFYKLPVPTKNPYGSGDVRKQYNIPTTLD